MWSRLKKEEGGFTLIELIIVIVILGIIAGVAIPKFIGLAESAKISAARGVGGALNSTITSLHANYLITGDETYAIANVVSDTEYSGGIPTPTIVGQVITLVLKGKTFTWTYVEQDGETPGNLAETSGFE